MKFIGKSLTKLTGTKQYMPRAIMTQAGENNIIVLELDRNFSIIYYDDVGIAELYNLDFMLMLATTKDLVKRNTKDKLEEVWDLCATYYQKSTGEIKASDNGDLLKEIKDFIQMVEGRLVNKGR